VDGSAYNVSRKVPTLLNQGTKVGTAPPILPWPRTPAGPRGTLSRPIAILPSWQVAAEWLAVPPHPFLQLFFFSTDEPINELPILDQKAGCRGSVILRQVRLGQVIDFLSRRRSLSAEACCIPRFPQGLSTQHVLFLFAHPPAVRLGSFSVPDILRVFHFTTTDTSRRIRRNSTS
jgi:hypothetical protein